MLWYVYAISSQTRNYIYVGLSNDVSRRLAEHNKGYSKTTKPYAPFKLIYQEEFSTRALARKREKFLKGGSGKKYLKQFIE